MKNNFLATRLNVEAFATASGVLTGEERLSHFERLIHETLGLGAETTVSYSARGELKHEGEVGQEVWLHLAAQAVLPLTCQRCLGPVDMPVSFERSFRFVATEELAAALDEESEEDVLVSSREFKLLELIEDELLMGLPAVPKHEVCPRPVKLEAVDADFVDEPVPIPHPFAALEQLKKKPSS
jgi:uncharacterized protein